MADACPPYPEPNIYLSRVPGGLTATVAAQTATLRWQAPTTGGLTTAYQVQHKLRSAPDWPAEADAAAVTGLSHALTALTADAAYDVRVRARNPIGASAWVETDFTAGPEVPGEPVMVEVAVQAQTATVSWQVPTTGGTPDGYHLQYRATTADWPVAHATVSGLREALAGLTAEADYEVRVRASNVSGQSAWVAKTFTAGPEAPGEPVMVEVAVEAQTATVSWQVPTTGGTPAGYHVQHKLQATPDWPTSHEAVTGLRHALTGLTADAAYDVRVRTSNATGQSAWVETDFTAGPALPGVPGDLTVTAGGTSLALEWTAPTTGGAVTGYRVEWRPATATLFEVATVAGPHHTLSGLKPDTAYAVQVAATNASGAGPAATQSATTLQVAPGIPTDLVATPDTATSATVRWAAPATGGVPDEYHLQSKTRDAQWPAMHTVVHGLSHSLSGLTSGAAYDVRVRAGNSAGQSAWVETAFTAEEPLPGVPTEVGTTYATANELGVDWTAPAGAPAADHYEVQVRATENLPEGSLQWPADWEGTVVAAPATTVNLAVLDGQAFEVRVRSAVGDPTISDPVRASAWVTATVAARASTVAPPAPTTPAVEPVPESTDRYRFVWDLDGTTGQAPDHFRLVYGTGGGQTQVEVNTPHWEPAEGLGPDTAWWALVSCVTDADGLSYHQNAFGSGTTPAAA